MASFFPLLLISQGTYHITKGQQSLIDMNTWGIVTKKKEFFELCTQEDPKRTEYYLPNTWQPKANELNFSILLPTQNSSYAHRYSILLSYSVDFFPFCLLVVSQIRVLILNLVYI